MGNTKQKENQERLPESNDFELLKKSIEEKKEQGDIKGLDTLLNEVKNNNQLTERQKKILNKQCENAQKEIQTQIESEAEKLRKSIQREQITATADNTTEPQQDKKEIPRHKKFRNRWGGLNNTEKTGAVAGAAVSGGILIRAVSKLFGGKKKEEDKKKEEEDTKNKEEHRYNKWRGKLGLAATAGIAGWQFIPEKRKDKLTDRGNKLFGKDPLNTKDSFTDAVTDFKNNNHFENIPQELDFSYNEQTKTVKAFGNEVEVEIDDQKGTYRIKGLDINAEEQKAVEFKNKKELFQATFLIGFMKYLFQGHCENNTPFTVDHKTGDINVNITEKGLKEAINGSGNQVTSICMGGAAVLTTITALFTKNAAATGGVAIGSIIAALRLGNEREHNNFLAQYCPTLDEKDTKEAFARYLNGLGKRETGNQDKTKVTDSCIKKEILEVIDEIEGNQTSEAKRGNSRDLDAIPDKDKPKHLTIKSYQGEEIKVSVDDSTTPPQLKIEGLESPAFPIKEGIRFANLINYRKYQTREGNDWEKITSDVDENKNFKHNYFYYEKGKGIKANVKRSVDRVVLEDTDQNRQAGKFYTLFTNIDECLNYVNHLTFSNGKSIRTKE